MGLNQSYIDGWITTGGTYAGIMKYVGEAVREFAISKDKQVLLGIANWMTISNKEKLRKNFFEVLVNFYLKL